MPIDINNISNNSTQTKRASDNKHVKVVSDDSSNFAPRSDKSSAAQDSVSLTGSAVRIQALEELVARLPIVDTQKVEEIRNSISNGNFEFNSDRIAEKMIQLEKELF